MQTPTGESSQTGEVDNASRVAASSPMPLPTEIMLQILGDVLELPNGIHSDRWATIKRARVDKFSLVNKDMRALVPEAFYKSNKVIIKAKEIFSVPSTFMHRPCIIYPDVEHSNFVRELEFQPHMWNNNGGPLTIEEDFLSFQVAWLQKLASGVLGFSKLDVLRIVLAYDNHDFVEYMRDFINHLEVAGPIAFSTKRLEVVVNGHSCSQDNCTYQHTRCTKVPCCRPPGNLCNQDVCDKYKQLARLLVAKPREQ